MHIQFITADVIIYNHRKYTNVYDASNINLRLFVKVRIVEKGYYF